MQNHENRPRTMENQPGTIKKYENRPGTMIIDENQPGTMKNQPGTMENHENRPGTMQVQPGRNKQKRYKQNLPIIYRSKRLFLCNINNMIFGQSIIYPFQSHLVVNIWCNKKI